MKPCDEITQATVLDEAEGTESQEFIVPEDSFRLPAWIARPKSLIAADRDRTVLYCVVASVLLHFLVFTALPRVGPFQDPRSFLKPGEKVTPVKLVEFPTPQEKPEPPPEKPAAISDRNHTTQKERLPRRLPDPKPPMGTMEPPRQRMASLMPPPAPEDFVKPKEEHPRKPDRPAPLEKETKRPKTKPDKERPRHLTREELKNRDVDLRPSPQEIAKGFSSPGGSSDFHPEGDPDEAVVDINTREDRFVSYLLHLKHKIQGVWVYPSAAAKAGIGGGLTLEFSIAKGGELLGVRLLDSSGHPILDENAVKAVQTAAPYNPLPERLHAKRLRVRANFIYITSNYFGRIM